MHLFFLVALLFQCFFVLPLVYVILRYRGRSTNDDLPVSVVICALNERRRLERYLPLILEQEYPEFEVLIFDDGSEDGTAEWLSEMTGDHENLTVVQLPEMSGTSVGKKRALEEAIRRAKYDHILLTDADCRPAGKKWILRMTAQFTDKKTIVLGIGQYDRGPEWWNILVQYETWFTAFCYVGFALIGRPYMGVGRNLAYHRRLLLDKPGLFPHKDLLSGDDDLFIQSVANRSNTAVCLEVPGHTLSEAPASFLSWMHQKQRHYSTAGRYPWSVSLPLLLFKLSFYLFHFFFFCLLMAEWSWEIPLLIYLLRWGLMASLYYRTARKMGFHTSFYLLPCFEIYFAFFDLWLLIKNIVKLPIRWK